MHTESALTFPATTASVPVEVSCVDCGSSRVQRLVDCQLALPGIGLPDQEKQLITAHSGGALYRCHECKLGFRFPQLTEQELQVLYSAMPTRRWKYDPTKNIAWDLARRWLLKQPQPPSGSLRKLLDVGAFDGVFLSSLDSTYSRFAIEPSHEARQSLRSSGVQILGEFLKPPGNADRQTMDVVTLFDVFEHLRQPGLSLSHAWEYLKPGGLLIVSTGNLDHWTWRWTNGDHWYSNTVQHLTFASPSFFRNWARKHGGSLKFEKLHPHQKSDWLSKMTRSLDVFVWGARMRPIWRTIAGGLMRIPGCSAWRHRQQAPYAPELADHILVVIQKC